MKNHRMNILVGTAVDAQKQALEKAALLKEIMQESRIKPDDESHRIAKKGVEVFLSEITGSACQEQRAKKP